MHHNALDNETVIVFNFQVVHLRYAVMHHSCKRGPHHAVINHTSTLSLNTKWMNPDAPRVMRIDDSTLNLMWPSAMNLTNGNTVI